MDQLWHQISFLSLVLSAFLVPVDPQELQLTMASDGLERAVESFWEGTCTSPSRSCFFVRLCRLAKKQTIPNALLGLQGDH